MLVQLWLVLSLLLRVLVGLVGGLFEDWRAMVNSTQSQVNVEIDILVELGNKIK